MTALKYLPWTHFRFCYQFCYLNQIPGYLSSFLLLTPTPLTYHILLWLLVLFHITLGGHSSSDKGLGWAWCDRSPCVGFSQILLVLLAVFSLGSVSGPAVSTSVIWPTHYMVAGAAQNWGESLLCSASSLAGVPHRMAPAKLPLPLSCVLSRKWHLRIKNGLLFLLELPFN